MTIYFSLSVFHFLISILLVAHSSLYESHSLLDSMKSLTTKQLLSNTQSVVSMYRLQISSIVASLVVPYSTRCHEHYSFRFGTFVTQSRLLFCHCSAYIAIDDAVMLCINYIGDQRYRFISSVNYMFIITKSSQYYPNWQRG